MQIRKQPEGLTIALPDELVSELGSEAGATLDVRVTGPWAFDISRRSDRERAIERLRAFRGMLPAGFVFDRDEANT
ncbi:MazE family transcriptional regulator [Tistrella mobilis]|uniref:Transcriptional regulator/antitoxin, MazE n=1 Tax=Tistrella mobilis (strain KA081020-065) TaxID=1110502 RepID=I3TU01_TISMK|nr:MazE family transcriptional regulator [Tistrella mobilis]AFK56239.1 transcriptional regulator/antitoxin, MazE [Tistrella mobilis KA081020-065]